MEKIALPAKTKIAAWWMQKLGFFFLAVGVIGLGILIILSVLFIGVMDGPPVPSLLLFGIRWLTVFLPFSLFMPDMAIIPLFKLEEGLMAWEFVWVALLWSLISGIFLIILSHFLSERKKWAWIFSSIFLLMNVMSSLLLTLYFVFVSFLLIIGGEPYSVDLEAALTTLIHFFFTMLPYTAFLILLLRDRKNYWKIAS